MFRALRHAIAFPAFLAAAVLTGPTAAAPVRTAHVEAELVAARTALVSGSSSTVALRLRMDRGWHTYWQNPGESGLPTTLAWNLPSGLSAGPILWPAPQALPVGPLMNYGFEGEVLLLTEVAVAPAAAGATSATLAARADWLVCKEICIPEGADLALTLPIAASAAPDPKGRARSTRRAPRCPVRSRAGTSRPPAAERRSGALAPAAFRRTRPRADSFLPFHRRQDRAERGAEVGARRRDVEAHAARGESSCRRVHACGRSAERERASASSPRRASTFRSKARSSRARCLALPRPRRSWRSSTTT
jgi:DsbC/DsbD-like thiol-disulfide interchange protein